MTSQAKQAIFVTGMHRSGTSLLTGILHHSNLCLGKKLLEADLGNPKGYWENMKAVLINEKILAHLGLSYKAVKILPHEWHKKPGMEQFSEEISNFIESDFHDQSIWALKDPRLCLLAPIWHEVCSSHEIEVKYIVAYRNPLEVADSLQKRDLHPSQSLFIWLLHNLMIERFLRNKTKVFVSHQELLSNWQGALKKIDHNLSTQLTRDINVPIVDDFVSSELYHHKHHIEELSQNVYFQDWIQRSFDALNLLSKSNFSQQGEGILNEVWQELLSSSELTYTLIFALDELTDSLVAEKRELGQKTIELKLSNEALSKCINSVKNSSP